jgi:hypothetical protein
MFIHEHAPVCQNPERCKIYKCQFRHFVQVVNDDESENDSDDDPDDNDIAQIENDTNPVCCDYGLCDLQSIYFKIGSFKTLEINMDWKSEYQMSR